MIRIGLLLFVVFAAFDSFYLLPWARIPGVFNFSDLGLLGILGALLVQLGLTSSDRVREMFRQPEVWLALVYLVIVLMQVSLAGLNYRQSVVNGVVAARHQFYYLSLPLVYLCIRSLGEFRLFLKLLSLVACAVFALALVNYFVAPIFTHRYAEGHHTRMGVVRGFIPGMALIGFAAVWEAAQWVGGYQRGWAVSARGLWLFAAHFFRQTRSRLVAITLVWVALLLVHRRFGLLVLLAGVFSVAALVAEMTLEENLMVGLFTSTAEDIGEVEGTWNARLQQLEVVWHEFQDHPILGSGATILRITEGTEGTANRAANALAHKADLGYPSMLKAYGLVGVLWLVGFLSVMGVRAYRAWQSGNALERCLALFCLAYLLFVGISGLTINHFMFSEGILMLCIVGALVASLRQTQSRRLPNEAGHAS